MKKAVSIYLLTGALFAACNAQKSVDPGGGSYVPAGTERTGILDKDTVDRNTAADTAISVPDTLQRPE